MENENTVKRAYENPLNIRANELERAVICEIMDVHGLETLRELFNFSIIDPFVKSKKLEKLK